MSAQTLKHYVAIARPDHWTKNIFMLFGAAVALVIHPQHFAWYALQPFTFGLIATCLIASSNYVLNEILDAAGDREHPEKCRRPIPNGLVSLHIAYLEWIGLGCLGLVLAWTVNLPFFFSALSLWVMGLIYNIPPIRSKELPIIDVLSEAINNPIRFLLGWYSLSELSFPPSSILIAYWFLGSFFMAAKRFSEYREIGNPEVAVKYRRSFNWYTEDRLIISMIAYGSGFMFFFAAVMTKYHPELIVSAPLLMFLMAYITKLSFEPGSLLQHPEHLFKRPLFVAYALCCVGLLLILSYISIPALESFLGLEGRRW